MAHEDRQNYLGRAYNVLRHRLFEPMGIAVPSVPVTYVGDWQNLSNPDSDPHIVASTRHDRFTGRAKGIEVTATAWPDGNDPLQNPAAVMAHEMIHVAYPQDQNHGPLFAATAKRIGLIGPAHATIAGPQFLAWCKANNL
jgi:hypothetical protein